MKITAEHYNALKADIIDAVKLNNHYPAKIQRITEERNQSFSPVSYMWSLFHYVNEKDKKFKYSTHHGEYDFYSYMNDTHINTALMKIFNELVRLEEQLNGSN